MPYRKVNGRDEFYSGQSGSGKIDVFYDADGEPTTEYPHVHIIHRSDQTVDVLVSLSRGDHRWKKSLENPSGNEVSAVVREACSFLREASSRMRVKSNDDDDEVPDGLELVERGTAKNVNELYEHFKKIKKMMDS